MRRGDFSRAGLLFLYLFLVITTYVAGRVARDALFLDQFRASQLPFVDISIAVLVGFVAAGYMRIARKLSPTTLFTSSLLFFAANSFAFWYLSRYYHLRWLFPAFYIWVGIFGVLCPAQVWTLANYVLTTREAKRLFGVIGAGGIVGGIFGGYVCKSLPKIAGTESLLLLIAILLAAAAVPVYILARRHGSTAGGTAKLSSDPESISSVFQSMNLIWRSRYLRAIALLVLLSSYATTMTGWQFKAIAKHFLRNKEALALFFGSFYFYAGILCLLFQLLLTGRVLRRFGIGLGLVAVPIALILSSFGVLIWGTLAAVFILKGSDQVLRYSLDRSTVELLYLPVTPKVKFQVKPFIDTVIWRSGDGLSGVLVLFFATYLHLRAPQLSWVTLVLLGAWLGAAFVARKEYIATLRESVYQHRLDTERASAPVLDRSTAEIFASGLKATDPKDVLYALSLFDTEQQTESHPVIRDLLNHPTPEVKQKAIEMLAKVGDKTVVPRIQELLHDPHLGVRTEALLYLAHFSHVDPLDHIQELGDFPDFSMRSAVAAFLSRPGPNQSLEAASEILNAMLADTGPEGKKNREEAARLLVIFPDCFDAQLEKLLSDPEREVVVHGLRAVGQHRKRRFVSDVLRRLPDPQLRKHAIEALADFGDTIVGTLGDHLCDPAAPMEVRREIPAVLQRIGTANAQRVLMDNLLEPDNTFRFRVISALNKLQQTPSAIPLDAEVLETALQAEIMGHYRSYQVLGMLQEAPDQDDPITRGLRESIRQEVERIFRLMSLMHPHLDLHSAYVALQSKERAVHDNALEFLDNILKKQLRNLLVPLIDGEVTLGERIRVANHVLHTDIESKEKAVEALVKSDDPWLRACGAYAIGSLGLANLSQELQKCLEHPDPLLRETARQAQLRLAAKA
ncbi:MAG TPA: Npt1/Npt2 family nucleotide transporter [Terriglobales bacterium]|nr:Npt1/Npt2 family nucleotide transporter [Terriglobales bacterium]